MRRLPLTRNHFALLLAFAFVTACAHRGTIMRNPLQYGTVDENRAVVPQRREDQRADVPEGTLYDDASITRLDNASICFAIRVRRVPLSSRDRIELQKWETVLRPDNAGAIAMPASYSPYPTGVDQVPNRGGGPMRVETHGGELCFNHGGRVSPATRSLYLDIRGHGTRARFSWKFGDRLAHQAQEVPPPAPVYARPAAPPPVEPAPNVAECTGTFSAPVNDVIAAMQRQANPEVERCFTDLRGRDSHANGNLQVVLTVGPDGHVSDARVTGTPSDPAFRSCIHAGAKTWTFPTVVNGACAVLVAPFALAP